MHPSAPRNFFETCFGLETDDRRAAPVLENVVRPARFELATSCSEADSYHVSYIT